MRQPIRPGRVTVGGVVEERRAFGAVAGDEALAEGVTGEDGPG